MSLNKWRDRWIKSHAALIESRAECVRLREALDQLNSEVETVLNDAGQNGAEKAKSWLIARQREVIRGHRTTTPAINFHNDPPEQHGFARSTGVSNV